MKKKSKRQPKENKTSRRDFLKAGTMAGMGVAASTVPGAAQPSQTESEPKIPMVPGRVEV